jgi:hypothetical protein
MQSNSENFADSQTNVCVSSTESIPNPQSSEPIPNSQLSEPIPNPQSSEPIPNSQLSESDIKFEASEPIFTSFKDLIEFAQFTNTYMKLCGIEPLKYSN